MVCESSDVRKFLKKSKFLNFSELFKVKTRNYNRSRFQYESIHICCIQDTLSSRAALGLPSASREQRLYTRYPIVARRAWPTQPLGRVRRASKGILHTRAKVSCIQSHMTSAAT